MLTAFPEPEQNDMEMTLFPLCESCAAELDLDGTMACGPVTEPETDCVRCWRTNDAIAKPAESRVTRTARRPGPGRKASHQGDLRTVMSAVRHQGGDSMAYVIINTRLLDRWHEAITEARNLAKEAKHYADSVASDANEAVAQAQEAISTLDQAAEALSAIIERATDEDERRRLMESGAAVPILLDDDSIAARRPSASGLS